uniref:Uncharacterized protein n=1 Tax=Chromera velia CCMP2878 TaxID=1169474 RepID=A0A0G4FR26_9ALVE|eukprot:Cvel_3642.t1-p1 / transcript=Cvel_3642.t1 / gene=Cvel_3642 / organism=Chromera_velia_CCMP2878 / gene_product=hypothetical protein / transcript_product=hypothetical protein / location=Cvel_scaffold150:67005-74846(+) / protein_length=568 / sequence_SO=supercontig / SO=protein_coding / is_pseudo=false
MSASPGEGAESPSGRSPGGRSPSASGSPDKSRVNEKRANLVRLQKFCELSPRCSPTLFDLNWAIEFHDNAEIVRRIFEDSETGGDEGNKLSQTLSQITSIAKGKCCGMRLAACCNCTGLLIAMFVWFAVVAVMQVRLFKFLGEAKFSEFMTPATWVLGILTCLNFVWNANLFSTNFKRAVTLVTPDLRWDMVGFRLGLIEKEKGYIENQLLGRPMESSNSGSGASAANAAFVAAGTGFPTLALPPPRPGERQISTHKQRGQRGRNGRPGGAPDASQPPQAASGGSLLTKMSAMGWEQFTEAVERLSNTLEGNHLSRVQRRCLGIRLTLVFLLYFVPALACVGTQYGISFLIWYLRANTHRVPLNTPDQINNNFWETMQGPGFHVIFVSISLNAIGWVYLIFIQMEVTQRIFMWLCLNSIKRRHIVVAEKALSLPWQLNYVNMIAKALELRKRLPHEWYSQESLMMKRAERHSLMEEAWRRKKEGKEAARSATAGVLSKKVGEKTYRFVAQKEQGVIAYHWESKPETGDLEAQYESSMGGGASGVMNTGGFSGHGMERGPEWRVEVAST